MCNSLEEDSKKILNFILEKLGESFFNEDLGNEYYYSCLPYCVIDAVYSIGVKYECVRNVIKNVSNIIDIEIFDLKATKRSDESQQFSISSFLKRAESYICNNNYEVLATYFFYNRQRTSTRNGILKAEAVIQFMKVLQCFKIEYFQDIDRIFKDNNFETAIKEIKGQSSGISFKYFLMLSGNESLIKPDRMIYKFLNEVLGNKPEMNADYAQDVLLKTAKSLSISFGKDITPRYLDNRIWNYQRKRNSNNIKKCNNAC